MLFTDEEIKMGVGSLTVSEAWISLQLIEKALRAGIINSKELEVIAAYKRSMITAIKNATGKNIEEEIEKLAVEQKKEG